MKRLRWHKVKNDYKDTEQSLSESRFRRHQNVCRPTVQKHKLCVCVYVCRTSAEWVNPGQYGLVLVTSSEGRNLPYGKLEDILTRDSTALNCHTNDDKYVSSHSSLSSSSSLTSYADLFLCCSMNIGSIAVVHKNKIPNRSQRTLKTKVKKCIFSCFPNSAGWRTDLQSLHSI